MQPSFAGELGNGGAERRLEGALHGTDAHAGLPGDDVEAELVVDVLEDMIANAPGTGCLAHGPCTGIASRADPHIGREGLTEDAWAYLRARPWPGNVREIRHLLEAAAIFSAGPRIGADDLKAALGPWHQAGPSSPGGLDVEQYLGEPGFSLKDWLARTEDAFVQAAMRRANGVAAEAARLLGERPNTLRTRLRRSKR